MQEEEEQKGTGGERVMGKHPQPHEQWTTVLLPEIAWCGDDWPDYLSVAHDMHGEWRAYVPEPRNNRLRMEQVMTTNGEIDVDYFDCKLVTFKCKSCGWDGVVDDACGGYSFGDTDVPKFCPNCGRRVV